MTRACATAWAAPAANGSRPISPGRLSLTVITNRCSSPNDATRVPPPEVGGSTMRQRHFNKQELTMIGDLACGILTQIYVTHRRRFEREAVKRGATVEQLAAAAITHC